MTITRQSVPKVTIVIVTWNKKDDVLRLLDSLVPLATADVTVVVVDNASTDGSSAAIAAHSLPVLLLRNERNLGGAGGFDAGIRYSLDFLTQDYIWLLDNDAEVTADSLEQMIAVMEEDPTIGITGSCILNPDNRDQIVEAGGNIDFGSMIWKPQLRYEPYLLHKEKRTVEVDYVPACSALVRARVLDEVGSVDVRYFLHWDDVDLCCRISRAGHGVVACLHSVVFHATEKGYSPAVLYYDVRNSLLFGAKFFARKAFIAIAARILFRAYASAALFRLQGERMLASYLFSACRDFAHGRFGPLPSLPSTIVAGDTVARQRTDVEEISGCRRILVFGTGSLDDIRRTISVLRTVAPAARIVLAVSSERIGAYQSGTPVDEVIPYSLAGATPAELVKMAANILFSNFDCGVTAGTAFIVPFAFCVRRNLSYDPQEGALVKMGISLATAWKLPLAVIFSFLITPFTLVRLFLFGSRLRDDQPMENRLGDEAVK